MKDRIRKIIDSEQLSQSEFAEKVGVQRSNISHILSGRNNPSVDFIQKLLNNFTHINAEWIIMGTGNMYKNTGEDAEIKEDTENNNNKNTVNQQKIQYSEPPIVDNNPQTNISSNIPVTQTILTNPEQVLVLFDDQTFVTYKKRKS